MVLPSNLHHFFSLSLSSIRVKLSSLYFIKALQSRHLHQAAWCRDKLTKNKGNSEVICGSPSVIAISQQGWKKNDSMFSWSWCHQSPLTYVRPIFTWSNSFISHWVLRNLPKFYSIQIKCHSLLYSSCVENIYTFCTMNWMVHYSD